ncbi:MAG: hypothetical protein WBJ37_08400 [Bacteroidales bacterium]
MKKLTIFTLLLTIYLTSIIAQTDTTINAQKFKPFMAIGFDFILHNGIWGGTVPAQPKESSVNIGGTPFISPGFGVIFNYRFMKNLSLYFDGNMYTRRTPVAYSGSYAESSWVAEQNDYSTNLVGPFDQDAFYKVKTTGFRLGLRGYLRHDKPVDPWIGLYWGYYGVNHGVYNKNNSTTWGNGYDYVSGISLLNAGIDFWDKSRTIGFSIFVEIGAPADRNYKIENCLHSGWTFTDYGEGEPIFGYYRIGFALLSNSSKK